MSETVTYALINPFQFTTNRRVEELTFQTDLKVRDFKRLDQAEGAIEQTVLMLALLAGEPVELIDAMQASDFQSILKVMRPFLRSLLGTGGN
jgi:hypothetical protein